MELKDWISQTKTDNPELSDFITKLEVLISDTGFNIEKFEHTVNIGLNTREAEVNKSFNKTVNAKDKKDND